MRPPRFPRKGWQESLQASPEKAVGKSMTWMMWWRPQEVGDAWDMELVTRKASDKKPRDRI